MRSVSKLLFIAGLGATLIGGIDIWLFVRGTKEPERITLEQLGKKNGTTNVHVSITDFQFGNGYVREQHRDGRWSLVWIPLLRPGGKWTARPVVAWANFVRNDEELQALLERPVLTGVVTNGWIGVGRNNQDKFAGNYRNADLSDAIAFQIDGTFPSPWLAFPLTGIGLVLLTITIRMLIRLYFQPVTGLFREESHLTS